MFHFIACFHIEKRIEFSIERMKKLKGKTRMKKRNRKKQEKERRKKKKKNEI